MQKISELLGQRNVKGDFGVEIECEGSGISATPGGNGWNTEDDGSLRGRFPEEKAEFVFSKALPYKEAVAALEWLAKFQNDNGARFDFSFRTSVHVHMNMQRTTFPQYLNTIYTYLLLETVLVRYCGEERIGNRFCLRMQDGEGILKYVELLFNEGYAALHHIGNDNAKYAAINLAATVNYGSLEFRAMKGNMDVPYISRWIRVLGNLREFACGFKSPCEVHDFVVDNGATGLLKAVLKDDIEAFTYPDMIGDVMHSFSIILDLPHKYVNNERDDVAVKGLGKKFVINPDEIRGAVLNRIIMDEAIAPDFNNPVRLVNAEREVRLVPRRQLGEQVRDYERRVNAWNAERIGVAPAPAQVNLVQMEDRHVAARAELIRQLEREREEMARLHDMLDQDADDEEGN